MSRILFFLYDGDLQADCRDPGAMSSSRRTYSRLYWMGWRATFILLTAAVLLLAGCMGTSTPTQGKLEQRLGVNSLSSRQLGILVSDYANTFADTVKNSADEIKSRSTDVPARRFALKWKIRAVPMVYTVASRDDPLFGLADLWVLTIQQRELFDREDVMQLLGPEHSIAQRATHSLEEKIEAIARRTLTSPDSFTRVRTFVHDFASDNPITNLSLVRETLAPFYIEFMNEDTTLLRDLADVKGYAETALALALVGINHVPEIVRWQGELTLLDAESYPVVGRTVASLDALGDAATDLKIVVTDLPGTIDLQREELLRDVDRQRLSTLREIELLRRAVFVDVAKEREAVLSGIELQLQTTLDAIRIERETLTGEIPIVAEQAGEAVMPLTREVIDHAFWRAVQLVGLLAVLVIVAIVFLRVTQKRAA